MEPIFENRKLELCYAAVGDASPRKQLLANMDHDASDEDIVTFSQLMATIAPKNESLITATTIERNTYILD